MLISFSGAQSTGKSTLLKILKDNNSDIFIVDEVTRKIKRKFNMPINEDGGDLTQYMIMNDHIENVYRKTYAEHTILDRCAVDGIVYTDWLARQNKVSKVIYDAALRVYTHLIDKYDVIFYTNPHDVPLVDDGERSADINFRNDIIELFEGYLNGFDNIVTLSGTVEERLKIVKETLDERGLDIKIK